MSELIERLQELLRKPIHRPEDAKRAGRAAEVLGDLLRAKAAAESLLTGERREGAASPRDTFAGKPLHDAAEIVLEEAGEPLHAKELGRRIYARGWRHRHGTPERADQIVHQLAARLFKHPHRFRRIAPNTFALTKWGDGPEAALPTRPRLQLFRGPGGAIAEKIGESPDAAAGANEWRSS